MRRWLIVLVLAFGWLFSTPAHADVRQDGDTFQFSYTWGSVTRTFTDSVVTITVVNDITNKIGGHGEVIDTYRITLGDQVIEVTEKHGARDYTYTITESQTLTLEGIDRGFWAGFYGPVMTIAVTPLAQPVEPVTQSPQTESATTSDEPTESPSVIWDYSIDEGGLLIAEAPAGKVFSSVVARYVAHEGDCGLDVSEIVGAVLIGTSSGTIPADNGSFGDPCPGWYKKLIVSVEYSSALLLPVTESPVVTESATLSPEPEPQPTPTPSQEPSPSPEPIQPPPLPEPTPLETPTASFPTQSPEPEPTQSPTSSGEPVSPSPQVTEPTPQVPRTLEAQTPQVIEPSPVQSSEVNSEEPTTTTAEVIQIPEETFIDTVSSSIQASVTQAIGAVTEAVGELVEAFATAGLDMTPEQREEAQDVVVSTVMASQVAAGIRKIK
jgi:NACalpha-BTF3-like transcription factor